MNSNAYDNILIKMAKSYMDSTELEKIVSLLDPNSNTLIVDLFGAHNIRARGVLNMADIQMLPNEKQFPALSCFFQKVFDSYIEERIKRGFIPLKTLRSQKGVFE